MRENLVRRSWSIARKKHSSDQIVAILRQVEIAAANSFKSPPVLSQKPSEGIWSRWLSPRHDRAFRFGADALAMGIFSLFLACKTGETWRGQPNILSPMASPIGGNLAST
jgi:hypothetical protein